MTWVQPTFTDFLVPPRKRQKLEAASRKKDKKKEDPEDLMCQSWWERFKPKKREELIVNKKKLEEIEKWLSGCGKRDMDKGHILLVTGPSGCGKITSVRVLCKSLDMGLTEWINPISGNAQDVYIPQLNAFAEFVMRATRYRSVLSHTSKARVVVVKDMPNVFLRDPAIFHEFIKQYSKMSEVNLVFVVTEGKAVRELFPDDVKREAGVSVVSLNPLTTKASAGALQSLIRKSGIGGGCSTYVDSVVSTSCGDLRKAIETLHFLSAKNGGKEKVEESSFSSEDSLDIFRGLGRILYAKRESGKLVHDPDSTASTFESSASHFIAMLRENYPSTFSTIDSLASASTSLASSDLLLSDFVDAPLSRSMALSLTCRALTYHNKKPIKRFQHFVRPARTQELLDERREEIRTKFPSFTVSDLLVDSTTYLKRIDSFEKDQRMKELLSEFSYSKCVRHPMT